MADAADPMHEASRGSRDAWLRSGGSLLSTDYVIDETLTLIRMRLGLRAGRYPPGRAGGLVHGCRDADGA